MFASDWEERPGRDDHLPLEERGWVKRLAAREAAARRFDNLYPDFIGNLARASARQQQEEVLAILLSAGPSPPARP